MDKPQEDDSILCGWNRIKEWLDPNSETWGTIRRIRSASHDINARALAQLRGDQIGPAHSPPATIYPTLRASDANRYAFRARVMGYLERMHGGDQAHRKLDKTPRFLSITGAFQAINQRIREALEADYPDGR